MPNTSNSRVIAFAAIAAIAVVGGIVLVASIDEEPPAAKWGATRRAESPVHAVAPTSAAASASTTVTPPTPIPGTTKTSPVSQEFYSSKDLRAFYDKHASINSGESRYFLGRALATCNAFVDKTPIEVEKVFTTMGSPDHPAFRRRIEAIRELARQCSGFYHINNPGVQQLIAEAAAMGYPAAVAATLHGLAASGKPREAESRAMELLTMGDPEVIERLLPYLQSRASPMTIGDENQTPRPQVVADAWRLYSCSLGSDCSATSRFLLEACWAQSQCDALSVHSLYQDHRYSPADFQELLRARALIESSITQRNWRAVGLS